MKRDTSFLKNPPGFHYIIAFLCTDDLNFPNFISKDVLYKDKKNYL